MGLHDEIGLSVVMRPNLITLTRGTPNTVVWSVGGGYAHVLTDDFVSYSHTIGVVGGCLSAEIGIMPKVLDLEWWTEYALGMAIEVRSPAGAIVWDGFVNTLGISMGGLELELGPVTEIGNRVSVTYSPVETTLPGDTGTVRETYTWGENALSQERFGIRNAILSLGSASSANALAVRNFWLAENSYPRRTQRLGQGGGAPTLRLGCAGWWELLDFPYRDTATGTEAVETKIGKVLVAEPNGLFPGPHSLGASGVVVPVNDTQERTAQDVLRGLASLGDSTSARTRLMVGPGRVVTYAAMGSTPEYQQALSDPAQELHYYGGGRVLPWEAQPGRWLLLTDLFAGRTLPTDLRDDVRAMLIESVNYTAPYGLQLQAGPTDRLPQLLARAGLGGTGR